MPVPMRAEGVTLTYPGSDAPALDDVDLVVQPGECVALLGPNGAGKTTLIRTATGLRAPDTGSVRVAGGDPRRASVRATTGVMLQATAFPTHLTVRELVVGAGARVGRDPAAADELIGQVGLAELADRRSRSLSGGQRRRVQLARALVVDPELLILDEPTEGLDAEFRHATWSHLADRRDAGMAILLTTHLVAEAGSVADRVAVIVDGRIVANAAPEALMDRLHDRTITVHTDLSLGHLRDLPRVVRARRHVPPGEHVARTTIVTRDPEAVLRRLLADDPGANGLRVEGASLEDAVRAISSSTSSAPTTDRSPPAGAPTTTARRELA